MSDSNKHFIPIFAISVLLSASPALADQNSPCGQHPAEVASFHLSHQCVYRQFASYEMESEAVYGEAIEDSDTGKVTRTYTCSCVMKPTSCRQEYDADFTHCPSGYRVLEEGTQLAVAPDFLETLNACAPETISDAFPVDGVEEEFSTTAVHTVPNGLLADPSVCEKECASSPQAFEFQGVMEAACFPNSSPLNDIGQSIYYPHPKSSTYTCQMSEDVYADRLQEYEECLRRNPLPPTQVSPADSIDESAVLVAPEEVTVAEAHSVVAVAPTATSSPSVELSLLEEGVSSSTGHLSVNSAAALAPLPTRTPNDSANQVWRLEGFED